ncbi:hypothetical protein [Streptomyces boluensis]|uniref:Uncharacterized protein n=1 Tax=Streptomyces boluensis TaxID=1775135 RepID=A0A964UPG5_9ACTN|nr:hypothetical protein [Streptomyces boluensis]NBE52392.1 hypothetical protein [Streptomyces boluensis]
MPVIVGDTARRLRDQATYDCAEDDKAEADSEAAEGDIRKQARGIDDTYGLSNEWAEVCGHDSGSNLIRQVRQESEQSYGVGRDRAFDVLRGHA